MDSALLLKPISLPIASMSNTMTALATATASLYAPTSLPPTVAAGLPRRPFRVRPDGKCEACVCEICICGTHHCPPTPRNSQGRDGRDEKEQLTLTSHSRDSYPLHPSSSYPDRAIKPVGAIAGGGEWQGMSSYAREYVTHPYSSAQRAALLTSPPLFDTSEPLQLTTTSSEAFPRRALPPPGTKRPPSPFTSAGAFIASTTYGDTFPVHEVAPPVPFRPSHALHATDEDRDFSTNASLNYRGTQGERRPRMAPVHAMPISLGDSDDLIVRESEARSRYVQHDVERVAAAKPLRGASYDDDDGVQRAMLSESRSQYGVKQRIAAVGVKLSSALSVSGEAFVGQSVKQASYGRPAPSAYASTSGREHAPVVRDSDDRSWQTESRSHYQRKSAEAAVARPTVRHGLAMAGEEERSFETESRRYFTDHGDCQRERMVPAESPRIEDGAFEAVSTAHDAYRGAVSAKRALMRPMDALREREADERSWISENRYHYQEKTVEPCPAINLEDRTVKDRHGHIFYEKTPNERSWHKIHASRRSTALW